MLVSFIEKKLAACVQISGPLTSLYRWEGRLIEDQEWLLIIKSSKDHYSELEKQVRQIHVYEVPEILALSISDGNKAYLNWLEKELK